MDGSRALLSARAGPSSRCGTLGVISRNPPTLRRKCSRRPSRVRCALDDGSSQTLYDLRAKLEAAVQSEDYVTAAQLRDVLAEKETDARLAVEYANQQFYRAFQNGSMDAMRKIWGKGEHVQCVHPSQGCIAGDELVLESWRVVLGAIPKGNFRIVVDDVRVYVVDRQAYVTCVEIVKSGSEQGRLISTNLFEKQGEDWVIVHHHASPVSGRP
ncbi:hypothetical protein BSKO_11275 [Bryopsis sp. KO-2023]|nr:hypothetical protein BSKO_11275 [Bryopsis sp. KO-2023]